MYTQYKPTTVSLNGEMSVGNSMLMRFNLFDMLANVPTLTLGGTHWILKVNEQYADYKHPGLGVKGLLCSAYKSGSRQMAPSESGSAPIEVQHFLIVLLDFTE